MKQVCTLNIFFYFFFIFSSSFFLIFLFFIFYFFFFFFSLFFIFLFFFFTTSPVMPKYPRRRITADKHTGHYRQNAAGRPLCSACDKVLDIRNTRELRSFVHLRTLFTHKWYTLLCASCFTLAAKALDNQQPTCASCFCDSSIKGRPLIELTHGATRLVLCSSCAAKDERQLERWKTRAEL